MDPQQPAAEEHHEWADFTVASVWERFVATLEHTLAGWAAREGAAAAAGAPPLRALLHHRLPFRRDAYSLTLHPPAAPPRGEGRRPLADAPHKLQEWFGLHASPVLVLAPDSFSGRVLDGDEAATLLSAAAVALRGARAGWPAFVPVGDARRDGWRGVAAPRAGLAHFEADAAHGPALPLRLTGAREQARFLAGRLAPHAPAAAAACLAAADCDDEAGAGAPAASAARLSFAVRRCYEVPPPPGLEQVGMDSDDSDDGAAGGWDAGVPWRPWAAPADPVGGLELDLVWRHGDAAAAQAAGDAPPAPACAAAWRLAALAPGSARDDGRRGLLLRADDRRRAFLALRPVDARAGEGDAPAEQRSLHAALAGLAGAARWVDAAAAVGELASDAWWPRQGAYLPPEPDEAELQAALRELFGGGAERDGAAAGAAAPPAGKGAPAGSLCAALALRCAALDTPRAAAELWGRFVRELRLSYWEPAVRLPRLAGGGGGGGEHDAPPPPPDLRCCLVHQKLELLDACIHRRRAAAGGEGAPLARSDSGSSFGSAGSGGSERYATADEVPPPARAARRRAAPGAAPASAAGAAAAEPEGAVGELPGGAVLLRHPDRLLRVPATLEPPPLTEDAALEAQEVELLGAGGAAAGAPGGALPLAADGADGGADGAKRPDQRRLQSVLLLSDMRAFKAANPGAVLEDFVRWHSPRDWVVGGGAADANGRLSARMAARGNAWQRLWASAAPAPAAAQRPLFEPRLEGERALHTLETLPPAAVWAQLLAAGAGAAAAALAAAPAARRLPAVRAEVEALRRRLAVELADGVAAWEGGTHDGGGGGARLPPTLQRLLGAGAPRTALPPLLAALGRAERTVAAATSLLWRLQAVDGGAGADEGGAPLELSPAERLADALVAAALARAPPLGHGAAVAVPPGARAALEAAVAAGGGARWAERPFQSDWELAVAARGERHRLYVRALPAELRCATAVGLADEGDE